MRSKDDFVKDEGLNIWTFPGEREVFAYQDGSEKLLYQKMVAYKDRSTYSEEFYPYKNWPEEYHLSPVRTNVLRPLQNEMKPGTKVLELGCGCGAITRFLGELGCDVTAIEGSKARSQIAGVRCHDLPNVNIYCSDIQEIDFSREAFDVITMIGVFEYAALYWKEEQPFHAFLRFVDRHCHDRTLFLLAIENQLGLKYFNGLSEDHTGMRFFGINNLYQSGRKTAQTFTKAELARMLQEATRLQNLEFFYPFPDYKLPRVILTDEAFSNPDLRFQQILSGAKSRQYAPYAHSLFHEPSVLELLGEEGVAASFANSFIVLASQTARSESEWLAKIISNKRFLSYCTEITIQLDRGSLRVFKSPISKVEMPVSTDLFSFHPKEEQPFITGELLSYRWERILLRSRHVTWKALSEELAKWLAFLKENTNAEGRLPGDWYDAIPDNIIWDGENFQLIDREWQLKDEIPLEVVVIRGIILFFYHWEKSKWITQVPHSSLKSLIYEIAASARISMDRARMKRAWKLEAEFQSKARPGVTVAAHYKTMREMTLKFLLPQRIYFRFLQISDKLVPWLSNRLKRLVQKRKY
ncbi:class I SAM-dependent methyltransferase [Candidatus Neomarinimicrobiota bacterium]